MKPVIYVGMDVHKETITLASVGEGRKDTIIDPATIPHEELAIKRHFQGLKKQGYEIHACYEAGVTGYPLYRYLIAQGIHCTVAAPGRIPHENADRIKTDKKDAIKLARLLKNGSIVPVHVPGEQEEALRDYLRARDDLRVDLGRNRQRLMKFLMRKGLRYPAGKYWTKEHIRWLNQIHFDDSLLQATFNDYYARIRVQDENLKSMDHTIRDIAETEPFADRVGILRSFRGIDYLTAMFLICEVSDFQRFPTAGAFMSFLGLVPGEYSSGKKRRQTGITRAGSPLLRRILVEAAWQHRFPGTGSKAVAARRTGQAPAVIAIAEKASLRLHRKYRGMLERGKSPQTTITAVSRELAGFIWAAMKGPEKAA